MNLITNRARAYVNFGRWIADCPLGCGNALALEPGQPAFFCTPPGGCGTMTEVEWPDNAQDIWDALSERKMPRNRNWFPDSHELALRAGAKHGQTVAELRAEHSEAMETGD
jgi:hypothetical protein